MSYKDANNAVETQCLRLLLFYSKFKNDKEVQQNKKLAEEKLQASKQK